MPQRLQSKEHLDLYTFPLYPGIQVIGRLRPGVTLVQAQADLASTGQHLAEECTKSNAGHGIGALWAGN